MILALLLAAAAPATAEEAERAFAAAAQTEGQWTAFRATAAPHAVMFVPQQVDAPQWLKDRPDPPFAIMWWPAESWVSCDGSVAVNTGPWVRQGGGFGYFTTVWARQPDGDWKWLLDHGAPIRTPRPAGERAKLRNASCVPGEPRRNGWTVVAMEDRGQGRSYDESLRWNWQVFPDGSRRFSAELWTGAGYEQIVGDQVPAR